MYGGTEVNLEVGYIYLDELIFQDLIGGMRRERGGL